MLSISKRSQELADFYRSHLDQVILPFWLTRSIDHENGGYFTCFDNTGRRLKSTDKFVWAQGRMAWVLASLAEWHPEQYLEKAKSGVDFLLNHAFLPNGNCAFLLDKRGQWKEIRPGSGFDVSIYADCFVVMGLAKYAAAAADGSVLESAADLYDSIVERLTEGDYRTEPYPVPDGYKAHGVPMIALNTGQELLAALSGRDDKRAKRVQNQNTVFADEIMRNFVQGDCILEMIGRDNQPVDSVLGTYVNPGHTIECMWFIIHQALAADDSSLIVRAAALARKALDLGWDDEYGGLFQYVHRNGGPPRGRATGLEQEPMVQTVHNNWYNKLWWPHTEALYTFLLAWRLTGDSSYLDSHDKVFDYTFKTFPNPDKEIGEWIQIRDRQGTPETKVVALPAKDPYHIARNLLLIVDLLEDRMDFA